jgi:hypothetical protein
MHGCKLANIPYFLLNYRCGNTQVTQKHAGEMCIIAERIKKEYIKYVTDKLCSIDEEVSEYLVNLEDMERKQQISPDKMLQTIKIMYKNYLQYNE